MWRKGNPVCTVGENVNWCNYYKNGMEDPQKIKNRTTISYSNSNSGHLSKENKNTHLKRYMHCHVHCSITYNSQDMEAT